MVELSQSTRNGLSKRSAADTFQVRSVSKQRFVRRLGIVSPDKMQEITQALAIVLSITSNTTIES